MICSIRCWRTGADGDDRQPSERTKAGIAPAFVITMRSAVYLRVNPLGIETSAAVAEDAAFTISNDESNTLMRFAGSPLSSCRFCCLFFMNPPTIEEGESP
jgi:hypothetical protein